MHLNIQTDNNIKSMYESHSTYNQGDSGLDLFCPEDVYVKPGDTVFVNLGIKTEMVDNNGMSVSYYIYPRSSISKTPLMLANSVGVIDSGYRGYLKIALKHIYNPNIAEPYKISKGDRLVQICSGDLTPFTFCLVDTLSESERGDGGFGSTGK